MPPAPTLAGLDPGRIETFVERVTRARDFGPALDRWKVLTREGWDVAALTLDEGGQVVELVGLGFRYLELADDAARLSA